MKKPLIALGALAVLAPSAFASGAYLKVSPGASAQHPTNPGTKVKVYGSVGHGCQFGKEGDSATIYSKAFATNHNFAGIPSVSAPLDRKGNFSIKVKTKLSSGIFTISGRCGGGKFASVKLYLAFGY
jgi:hypothetical protein